MAPSRSPTTRLVPAGSIVFDVAGEVWKIGARIEEVDLCGRGTHKGMGWDRWGLLRLLESVEHE